MPQSCPLFRNTDPGQEQVPTCERFRKKTSAASAILLTYMELMDCLVSPSPPLIARDDMRVTETYTDPEGNVSEYGNPNMFSRWKEHKRRSFRLAHARFVQRYEAVGFCTTGKMHPETALPILNLDQWGDPNSDVVANPFRVREDTMIHKILGPVRFGFNRLGIGAEARKVWRNHKVAPGYDEEYCMLFSKYTQKYKNIHERDPETFRATYFPRPILDGNYFETSSSYNERKEGRGGKLYERVSNFRDNNELSKNGPHYAWARRRYIETNITRGEYVNRLLLDSKIEIPEQSELKNLFLRDGIPLTPAADCLADIHANFRKHKGSNVENKPEFWYDVETDTLVKPSGSGYEGSKFAGNEKTKPYNYANGIPGEATLPPPPLFSNIFDPTSLKSIQDPQRFLQAEKKPKWFKNEPGDLKSYMSFPYPVNNVSGYIDPKYTALPGGFSPSLLPPFKLYPTCILVMFPDTKKGYWDLRVSLSKLLRSMKPKLESTLASIKNWISKEDKKQENERDWRFEMTKGQNVEDINDYFINFRKIAVRADLPETFESTYTAELLPENNKNREIRIGAASPDTQRFYY
jgi:hypothetical protein